MSEGPQTLDLRSRNIQLIVECIVLEEYRHLTCSETSECVVGLVEVVNGVELSPLGERGYRSLGIECCGDVLTACFVVVVEILTSLEHQQYECVTCVEYLRRDVGGQDQTYLKVLSLDIRQHVDKLVPGLGRSVISKLSEYVGSVEQHREAFCQRKSVNAAVEFIKRSYVGCESAYYGFIAGLLLEVYEKSSGSAHYREVAADEQCDLRTLAGESRLENGALYQGDIHLGIVGRVVFGAYKLVYYGSLVTSEGNPDVQGLFCTGGVGHGGVILKE